MCVHTYNKSGSNSCWITRPTIGAPTCWSPHSAWQFWLGSFYGCPAFYERSARPRSLSLQLGTGHRGGIALFRHGWGFDGASLDAVISRFDWRAQSPAWHRLCLHRCHRYLAKGTAVPHSQSACFHSCVWWFARPARAQLSSGAWKTCAQEDERRQLPSWWGRVLGDVFQIGPGVPCDKPFPRWLCCTLC